jgi:hypothetical protein
MTGAVSVAASRALVRSPACDVESGVGARARGSGRAGFSGGGLEALVEFIVFAVTAFTILFVLALVASVFGVVMWAVFLPFRILGWLFQGFLLLLALPFLLLFGVIGFAVFGAGMLLFLLPVLPFVLIALGAWWLVRRRPASTASVTN